MPTHFLAPHPLFGTKANPKPLSYQQRSPYYWWWSYLRLNEDYLKCCANKGQGRLVKLYKDFGDVRGSDFKKWWTVDGRGARLFGEQPSPTTLKELTDYSEVPATWNTNHLMLVAVPLTTNKRYIKTRFNRLLKQRHTRGRGRTAAKYADSTARYPLSSNTTIDNLDKCLAVYLRHRQAIESGVKMPLWRIGAELRLIPSAIPKPSDLSQDAFLKRRTLASAVSRYLKQANRRISNVVKGVFP